ncbi:hypothetical protein FCR2A7T_03390 [Flavobacterium cauense R2A-7]|uniref:50S ribosomal protein L27 n=1 Tax=Flavobacterium cauense R2A-7 TaxID=1341154 RepID=V6SBU4_9FLAO|nr:hypothetical protein [Flavobacterium cauense]ESU21880.1 hypothetical protein FCR2A7T_03390 [Flavobacterium cauense R2A-7]KGO81447.1 hypothetical protein Q762_09545 [Flavobacterium cauense R2A-7]TWI13097.1 hypothetical protein IP98_01078 [Flavobacterium cauense R2A-7]
MYDIIQKAHSGVAYLALAVLLFAVINALMGVSSKRSFEDKDRKISLFALIFCHIQLLLGLVVYFVSPLGMAAFGDMSNAALRLTSLEHPLVNILAIALITIGWSKHKKEDSSNGKFKKIGFLYLAGLLFILSRIPWNLWF